MTIERDLLELGGEEAVELKFQIGRALHGPKWVGRRPILEAHDEVLDALAYIREEMKEGELPELVLLELYMLLLNALQGVRVLVATAQEMEAKCGSQDGVEDFGGPGPERSIGSQRGCEGI
jgi:hypothetical protein